MASNNSELRKLTQQHKTAQNVTAQATGVGEMELTQRLIDGLISPEEFVYAAVGINKLGHDKAVQLAQRYVRDARKITAPGLVQLPTVAAEFDPVQSAARAVSTVKAVDAESKAAQIRAWMRAKIDAAVREQLAAREAGAARERISGTMRRWTAANVQNAHRSTVIRSAESAGSGWRVVTDGNPCSFCAMLASYSEDINGAEHWPDHYFHHDCGCTIQEVPLGMDVEYTAKEREFIALREAAEREVDAHPGKYAGSTKRQKLMNAMRAHGDGIVNDALVPDDLRKRPKRKKNETIKPEEHLLIKDLKALRSIKSRSVAKLEKRLSDEEIISKVGGWDKSDGSCVSLALATPGMRQGTT